MDIFLVFKQITIELTGEGDGIKIDRVWRVDEFAVGNQTIGGPGWPQPPWDQQQRILIQQCFSFRQHASGRLYFLGQNRKSDRQRAQRVARLNLVDDRFRRGFGALRWCRWWRGRGRRLGFTRRR